MKKRVQKPTETQNSKEAPSIFTLIDNALDALERVQTGLLFIEKEHVAQSAAIRLALVEFASFKGRLLTLKERFTQQLGV